MNKKTVKRVILIVLDSVGIGSLPDAGEYGDAGSNTLRHILEQVPDISLPNLTLAGLGLVDGVDFISRPVSPQGAVARLAEASAGKDTTTGHWELAGIVLDKPFPTFPGGFPDELIRKFEVAIGRKTLGNVVASGTEIIDRLGVQHVATGRPIVYTSADSVFQVAAHEDVVSPEELYEMCQLARKLLTGPMELGRVIARPFAGKEGQFVRTSGRKDFAVLPPDNLLDAVCAHGLGVLGIGKIYDIFAGKGITRSISTKNNEEGLKQTLEAIRNSTEGLIFTNLVDFDMHFGHRRDVQGYARCLEQFDEFFPELQGALKEDDLLVVTADHGNDPTWTGTDHTREYVPVIHIGNHVIPGASAGTRNSFADLGATISDALGIEFATSGNSYLDRIWDGFLLNQ